MNTKICIGIRASATGNAVGYIFPHLYAPYFCNTWYWTFKKGFFVLQVIASGDIVWVENFKGELSGPSFHSKERECKGQIGEFKLHPVDQAVHFLVRTLQQIFERNFAFFESVWAGRGDGRLRFVYFLEIITLNHIDSNCVWKNQEWKPREFYTL